ncbi:MAG: DUF4124 domain-containing protein [Gammaproteobacteria bacterium]
MKKYNVLWLVIMPLLGWGDIYKYTNQQGVVVFSDEATPNAEPVELAPLQSYSTSSMSKSRHNTQDSLKKTVIRYTHFKFLAPKAKETIWSNAGVINIDVALEPELEFNHRIIILLDGKPVIDAKEGTSFRLTGVERGSHVLLGQVKNAAGKIMIKTKPQALFLQKTTKLLPKKKSTKTI